MTGDIRGDLSAMFILLRRAECCGPGKRRSCGFPRITISVFRFIGPPGNRVGAMVGVPGDLNVDYAGTAPGGVWKSADGGCHWRPAQSIGSVAIASPDPNNVRVGTVESFIRGNVSMGIGIWK